ncbi:hypothetical protein HQ576_12270, partial [bacterium]|nr:hypothetical protein [bacterium]
ALGDGDLLVAGSRKTADGNADLVVQLSPEGALRRRLPRPSEPVQHVAAAIDGTRTLLLGPRATEAIHLIGVGPDGWLLRDAGTLKSMQKVLACRADRASAEHVLVVAELRRRQSAFRVKLGTSLLPMELSSAGLPGRSIPSHDAVDVASSATHLAVLAEDGKVLLFSTGSFPRYVGAFETSLRSPKAIAVLSDVVRRSVAGSRARSYACVLSGGASPAIHLWEVRAPAGGPVVATPLGSFPDAKRHPEAAQLSSPLAMESAFPDRPEMLFVLDGGGTRVRAYDVAEIAAKLSQQGLPDLPAEPVLKALPPTGSGAGFAVAPGRALHIADRQTGTLRTYTRCP